MNDYFNKNLKVLNKNGLIDIEKINNADESKISSCKNKNGDVVPILQNGTKTIALHSKYAPYKEAERFLSEIEFDNFNLFVVFGLAYAYHIEIILKKISRDCNVLVIEKDYNMLKSVLKERDMVSLLSDERFLLLVDPNEDLISKIMKGKSSYKITFISQRGSLQAYPDYYKNMSNVVKSYLSTKEANIATLAKFEKLWNSNIARNINSFINSPGINIFAEKFSDYEAIVVGAGPSLTDSIEFLKKQRDYRIIIAVDTAHDVLIKNGIVPHFTLCVDPQVVNARYFENCSKSSAILVVDPTVHPSVLRFYKGRVVTSSPAFDTLKWIEEYCGKKGDITHGGSVSTNAYDFAKRLGVKKIFLAGQDLAFTGGLAHAKGTYLDEQIHLKTNKYMNSQMFNIRQMRALPKVFIDGIKSNKVHTNQKMIIFLNWFENNADEKLFNATLDGAKIKGINHIDQNDIENVKNKDIDQKLDSIYEEAKVGNDFAEETAKKILKKNELFTNELESLNERIVSAIKFSEELLDKVKAGSKDRERIGFILNKLDSVDDYMQGRSGVKDMVGLAVQRAIHIIMEGYEISDDDDSVDLQIAKKSQFLYTSLKEGIEFNLKILAKMKHILENCT